MKTRALVMMVVLAVAGLAAGGCGIPFLPFAVLASANSPKEELRPIGGDDSHVFVTRMAAPSFTVDPLVLILGVPIDSANSFAPGYFYRYDVESIDLVTAERTVVRSDAVSAYGYYGSSGVGAYALADGRWVVSISDSGSLSVFDVSTQQERTLLDGLFNAGAARLAAVGSDRAIVTSPQFVLSVDLNSLQTSWYTSSELGFAPSGAAALDGNRVALVGTANFDPAVDPGNQFVGAANVYLLDLTNGTSQILTALPAPSSVQGVRAGDGKVLWQDYDSNGHLVVNVVDESSKQVQTVATLQYSDVDASGRGVANRLLDFGPAGVLYVQTADVADFSTIQSADQLFSTQATVHLISIDGHDNVLATNSQASFPLFPTSGCFTVFDGPAAGATLGGKLLAADSSECGLGFYDAASGAYNVVNPATRE